MRGCVCLLRGYIYIFISSRDVYGYSDCLFLRCFFIQGMCLPVQGMRLSVREYVCLRDVLFHSEDLFVWPGNKSVQGICFSVQGMCLVCW